MQNICKKIVSLPPDGIALLSFSATDRITPILRSRDDPHNWKEPACRLFLLRRFWQNHKNIFFSLDFLKKAIVIREKKSYNYSKMSIN